jgi:peptidoglycan/xylan/chitin deacetylase (PgdA/CDA1 family)
MTRLLSVRRLQLQGLDSRIVPAANLIANPSLETLNGSLPTGWQSNNWGENQVAFSTVSGLDGSRATRVDVQSLSSGDAKWLFGDVPVAPGTQYTFRNLYQATVETENVIRYRKTDGSYDYAWAGSVPASNATATNQFTFTAPAGVTSATVFHLIERVGSLTTDAYELFGPETTPVLDPTPDPTPTLENLIANANLAAMSNGLPTGWTRDSWGGTQAQFAVVAGPAGASALQVTVSARPDGDAKWYFGDVAVTPGSRLSFRETYSADQSSVLVARYRNTDGSYRYDYLETLPASAGWTAISRELIVPAGVTSLTVFHVMAQVGSLRTTGFSLTTPQTNPAPNPNPTPNPAPTFAGRVSLTFDDGWLSQYENALPILQAEGVTATFYVITRENVGNVDLEDQPFGDDSRNPGYMNPGQFVALEDLGYEIGAHTRFHESLPTLSDAELEAEIAGSKRDLLAIGIDRVDTLAFPYGDYNSRVIDAVENAGFVGARSVDRGFNTGSTNPFALKIQQIDRETTAEDVQAWTAEAARNGTWLILMYHDIDDDNDFWGTTPEFLQRTIDIAQAANLEFITVRDGLTTPT